MTHEQKIERIAGELSRAAGQGAARFRKSSPSHQVPKRRGKGGGARVIDVSDLDEILELDVEGRTCTAEPGLTFDALVQATLAHGLVPACVPELKTITIGGAVAGCSVESMSHRLGGFHDNCLEYEVLTAKGEVLCCSREGENGQLFDMVHGTFGTIALITRLKFSLLPAKPYVHLVFEHHDSVESCLAAIEERVGRADSTFIDGLGLSPGNFVLCLGEFVDEAPYLHSYQWMRAYHRSAARMSEDYMTAREYFFRYDADCHWIGRNYGLENPLVRLLVGKIFLGSTRMLSLARKLPFMIRADKPEVVVDVFVPISKARDFLDFYGREFNYWPLWIVPYRIARPYPWISPEFLGMGGEELYLDFAVYGFRPRDGRNYFRLLEEKLVELKGIKTLISHNFYERQEFWRIWNRGAWDAAKRRTDPEGLFGDLYDKTHRRG